MGHANQDLELEFQKELETSNQRKHDRFLIEDSRHWQMKVNDRHFHVYWLQDFSASGIQIRQSSRRPAGNGETFKVELKYHGKSFLNKNASVKWVKKDPEHVNMNIVGLEFVSPEGKRISNWKTDFSKKNLISCDEEFVKSKVTEVVELKRNRFQLHEMIWILSAALPFLAGYLNGYLG